MGLLRRSTVVTDEPDGDEPAGTEVEVVAPEEDLPPSRMRGTEVMYGYVIALELLVVAILNLTVTGGTGAPAKPDTGLDVLGVFAAGILFPLILVKRRTVVGLAAIIAAFFVTLPKVPTRLSLAHLFALLFPVVYALILTQRQRKATGVTWRGARTRGAAAPTAPSRSRERGRSSTRSAPARRSTAPVKRSTGRYTPPKAKRGRR